MWPRVSQGTEEEVREVGGNLFPMSLIVEFDSKVNTNRTFAQKCHR